MLTGTISMPVHDPGAQRVYLAGPLTRGQRVAATSEQANYLLNVLRLKTGSEVLVFNGADGEWRAVIAEAGKRGAMLDIADQTRAQTTGPDIDYVFAPLKRARLDYMVQKAAEMGVKRLCPVLTQHTIAERVNLERMQANAIEAAEQCGILHVPDVLEPQKFDKLISNWPSSRPLVFCDEEAGVSDPVAALKVLPRGGPIAVIVGPEGGFSNEERRVLRGKPFTIPLSLGPRILRADTAAIAALTLVNAVSGDWSN
jgi:16S rRNA (uracil1498-N3)-methyltransferase